MSAWRVNMVSAYGRGSTLAQALHSAGFKVRVFDFTAAFPGEYQRGAGPFPLINKTYVHEQVDWVGRAQPLSRGLSFWLSDGPLEPTGPYADLAENPALRAWKNGTTGGEFSHLWLNRFLKHWCSPYYSENWTESADSAFPAAQPMAIFSAQQEADLFSFEGIQGHGVDVVACQSLTAVRVESSRLTDIEVTGGSPMAASAEQWIWCLSSAETRMVGEAAGAKIFRRGARAAAQWTWLSFTGQMQAGVWSDGIPEYILLMGDVYLPWIYANASIMRRVDATRWRFWLKVPRARVNQIDARRGWAVDLERLLRQRLPLADWKIDSADWSLCPHTEIFAETARGVNPSPWKNWDWIAPETLPRLDWSARLEAEAKCFARLQQWRVEQTKKQGARRDQPLHAP